MHAGSGLCRISFLLSGKGEEGTDEVYPDSGNFADTFLEDVKWKHIRRLFLSDGSRSFVVCYS